MEIAKCLMCRTNDAIHPDKPICMSLICQITYNERAGIYAHDNKNNRCRVCGVYTTAKLQREGRICGKCNGQATTNKPIRIKKKMEITKHV